MLREPLQPRPCLEGTEQRVASIQDSLMFFIESIRLRFGTSDEELSLHLSALAEWYDDDSSADRFELVEPVEPRGRKRKRAAQ